MRGVASLAFLRLQLAQAWPVLRLEPPLKRGKKVAPGLLKRSKCDTITVTAVTMNAEGDGPSNCGTSHPEARHLALR